MIEKVKHGSMRGGWGDRLKPVAYSTPEVWERLVNAQPTRTAGKPEDVAWAVQFFAAPESSFITGQVMHVCGGKSVKSDW